ncbi:hypothetical protein D9756_008863 [Leucocoprinus leucothites]|uniref:DUF6593 domain-containing protein n=1 Tax=Leucocoprinus leucothites TaxID=201217 RepID=A0A8H5CYL9_9AGAR|nr:hypothetical protein D9756_008863 [Leucoagaricus leucothites]
MRLFLSSPSALNSYYWTEAGHPLYKVETPPVTLGGTRRTFIRRAVETVDGVWIGDEKRELNEELNDSLTSYLQSRSASPSSISTSSYSDTNDGRTFEGHFAHLAHIEYGTFKPSRILYAGQEVHASNLFRSQGWSWYGLSRHKVFRASDGCEYRWVISSQNPKLVSNDSSKTVIARFHCPKSRFIAKPELFGSSLQIYPEGEHIFNDILITFVYLREAEEG